MSEEMEPAGAMTAEARDFAFKLCKFAATGLAVLKPADVVNAFMTATITAAQRVMPAEEIAAWLRELSDEVERRAKGQGADDGAGKISH